MKGDVTLIRPKSKLMAFHDTVDRDSAYQLGSAALLLAVASLTAALAFEYVGGYRPCPLCLMQRYAYYVGAPALFAALVLASGGRKRLAALIFCLVSAAFLANAALGVYHAGAEWKFWPGPSVCGGDMGISTTAGDLLKNLETIRVPRCDEASWRLFGLSFAGWNVIVSLLVALLAARASAISIANRRRSL